MIWDMLLRRLVISIIRNQDLKPLNKCHRVKILKYNKILTTKIIRIINNSNWKIPIMPKITISILKKILQNHKTDKNYQQMVNKFLMRYWQFWNSKNRHINNKEIFRQSTWIKFKHQLRTGTLKKEKKY